LRSFLQNPENQSCKKFFGESMCEEKQTAPQLAKEYKCSEKWIRQELDKVVVKK